VCESQLDFCFHLVRLLAATAAPKKSRCRKPMSGSYAEETVGVDEGTVGGEEEDGVNEAALLGSVRPSIGPASSGNAM
jgi:hypothetical protein